MFKFDLAPFNEKYDELHETNRATKRADRKFSKFIFKTPTLYTKSDGTQRLMDTKAAKIISYKGTPQSRAAKIRFSKELARRPIKGHDSPTNCDNFEKFKGEAYSLGS
jgi:hypothetical protein